MANKKAIIHIGGHKTGTSAIQAFCVLNAVRLQQANILYPLELVSFPERTGGQAHHCLVNLLMDATTFWKFFNLRPKGMTDAAIVATLKSLPRDKNIVLSSENLVWLDNNAIVALKELLTGFDVYAILYARRQDDAAQALYQTVVASIGETQSFNDYMNDYVMSVFQYDTIAENWQSVLGKGKVIVRAYEKNQLFQKDSILDFFHVLEDVLTAKINLTDWARDSSTLNRGVPAHLTNLIRKLNYYGYLSKRLLIPAVKLISQFIYRNSRGSYEIISPQERKAVLEKFAEGNAKLAKNFLGRSDGVLFQDLSIKQTDEEWRQKYNQPGSQIKLLLRDLWLQLVVHKAN